MSAVSSGKASVAWFKLAECMRRGEKERSLSVYRLLVHSLPDKAVAWQLKGDILAAFSLENDAADAYAHAAELFEQNHKYGQAAYAYHCIVHYNPRWYHGYDVLVRWYAARGLYKKARTLADRSVYVLITDKHITRAYEMIQYYKAYFNHLHIAQLYEVFVCQSLQQAHGIADRTMINTTIAHTIDTYQQEHKQQALQAFVDTLATLDEQTYAYAQAYYEKG